jgi:uncharacterized protein YdeI (YjbR/CyaY-like superfamily)
VNHTDPRVDTYIARSADFAKPILTHLRRLVHKTCPDVEETIKWGFPHFLHHGILCGMAAFKRHCALIIWQAEARKSLGAEKSKGAMGHLGKIAELADLPGDAALARSLKQAMKLNAAGVKRKVIRSPVKKLVVPSYIKQALKKKSKALATFNRFSPSQRKEYVEWVEGAKREETRAERLKTMLEWLTEGKTRNWKYERKPAASK